jgi:hypothetical protein
MYDENRNNFVRENIMSFDEFLKKTNDFLFEQSGMINTLFKHTTEGKHGSVSSLFFQPYQSKSDFMYRNMSIVTAPVCMSLLALELAVASFYMGLKSMANLVILDTSAAKRYAQELLLYSIFSFIATVAAIASPFVNLVDMVGSVVTSITHKDEAGGEEEIAQPMQATV